MLTLLSTEAIDPRQRFASFQKAISSEILSLSARRIENREFSAAIRRHSVGCLKFSFVDCQSVVIERSLNDISSDRRGDMMIGLQLEGISYFSQMGREVEVTPGDYGVADATLPYVLRYEGPVKRLLVQIPRAEFIRRGCVPESMCGQVFRGGAGTSGLASQLITLLATGADGLDSSLEDLLAGTALDVVASAQIDETAQAHIGVSQACAAVVRRARVTVLNRLNDPDLSVSNVADSIGISVRYLHKAFSTTGMSLHRWIEEERLRRCYHCLTDRNQDHRTILDIAFSNGFNDSGYFSRRFLLKFGTTPSQIRRRR